MVFSLPEDRAVFRALAYRFVAENAWAKDKYGLGLAYMTEVRA